jgi:hypothetical protein
MDLLILIGGVAVGSAIFRCTETYSMVADDFAGDVDAGRVVGILMGIAGAASPFLLALSGTLVVLLLRRPRLPWKRLTRLPAATVAMVTVVSALLLISFGTTSVVIGLMRGGQLSDSAHLYFFGQWDAFVGSALVGAWSIQLLSGRWRPEACWLDRFGRVLGAGWVASACITLFVRLVFQLTVAHA